MPGRYYGLRFISAIYKALCIITVLVVLGGLGYLTISAMTSPTGDAQDFNWWLPRAAALGLGGGFLALTMYVVTQVVDVLLSINDGLRNLAGNNESRLSSDKGMHASNLSVADEVKQLKIAVQDQNRLQRLQIQQVEQFTGKKAGTNG